ncbi:hypothetical protein LJ725_22105 [Reyranella aquatilis]|uniref:Uncharacterized protein n=1 Tax=Reyranella aquatilis TaxID=2035356 RepID=A0ABS8L025_9HYPH|nr:hypothetical protein [Reyranella aquatilis]MCC8431678.1 hypothetical protein [Reyranella aquatilis]
MSSLLLFRVTAVAVVVAGIAMMVAGGATSVWAWTTPDTHLVFRVGLPLATAWLVFTMMKLALALPHAWKGEEKEPAPDAHVALESARADAADGWVKKSAPDAVSVRQILLPREPEPRRRRRVAQRVELRGGRVLYRVVPARPNTTARRVTVAAALAVAGLALFLALGPIDLENVSWIASLFRALEELPGLFERVEAAGLLATLGFGARGDQQGL